MSDEIPLKKPEAKHLNKGRIPLRPISSGYELKKEIDPELQRNLPSEVDNKQKLNINAPSFVPKNKNILSTNEQKKPHEPYLKKNFNSYNNVNNNYMYNQRIINNNMNSGYYPNAQYAFNGGMYQNYNNPPAQPAQYGYQQNNFYPNMYSKMPGSQMVNPQFVYNKAHNNNQYYEHQNKAQQSSNQTPLSSSTFQSQKSNTKTSLKMASSYIPKSMRESVKTNEDNTILLSPDAQPYIPQNESLKKKEEEVNKKKLKEKENKEIEEEKKRKEKEEKEKGTKEIKEDKEVKKNEEIKENNKNEEEEKKPQNKETNKVEDKKDEDKNKTNDDNSSNKAEEKKKSKLMMLLNSNENESKKHKEKTKQITTESNITYNKNKKKPMSIVDKKINEINTKGKKLKEEEEKRKEEERKRKEEERKRKEEEDRKRKEEERKRKEEEERKRREEERKREEEEEKKRKEEEKKRQEEEEKRKQIELEEKKRKEEEEKNKTIERKYFIVFKNKKSEKKEYKYTFEYIMQFKKWKMSNNDDLLNESIMQHFEDFKEEEREGGKRKKKDDTKASYKSSNIKNNGPNYSKIETKKDDSNGGAPPTADTPSMEQWARKDMTKEIKAAEEFKQKLEETIKDDPIKRNLRSYLNMLTKDNYEETKKHILEIIKDNVDYQVKFLDVLFQKAVMERAYVEIYAKLCKELDKELPQKNPPKETKDDEKKKKSTSVMRAKLLDKCREIFQIKNNEKFDEYIKEKDPVERESKLKKFVLGNVYFITELIKIKILSKKIAPVCIKNLFERFENSKSEEKLKLINLQAIVIFTDQFGSLVHSQEKKIDSKDAKTFKESIDNIFQKLDKIKDEPSLPGYIKYSIINLIEKRKNNYQKTKYEEYLIAKSKKEVEKELENQDQISQDTINDKMKKGLIDYKDFVEEEGSSEKYDWKETTYLYDKKEKSLDDILEGYIVGCGDFIEKESNVKYAKDYIKELIEYYGGKIHLKEKKELKHRLLKLFDYVRDLSLETPAIYDIYAYIIFIFLENDIMRVTDLEEIIKEKDSTEEDFKVVSSVFKNVHSYYKVHKFKIELREFGYIKKNKELFEWVFDEENEEDEENNED